MGTQGVREKPYQSRCPLRIVFKERQFFMSSQVTLPRLMFQRHRKTDDFSHLKSVLHFVLQVSKTLFQKEPATPNIARRKSELFWTLLAQLFAQLFAQLSALSLSLLNTHEGDATSTCNPQLDNGNATQFHKAKPFPKDCLAVVCHQQNASGILPTLKQIF